MEIINEIATDFFEYEYYRTENPKRFASDVENELISLGSNEDKLNFLSIIKNLVFSENEIHKKNCTAKTTCNTEKDHLKTLYYLDNLLEEYGIIPKSDDVFSESEKVDFSEKLNKIIDDIEQIKQGQELIYDDLIEEINELKKLYFLGKRNWKQLLAGKTVEMVAGGIISETLSKKMISITGIVTQNLLK